MTAPAYVESGLNAELARIVKEGAVLIRPAGTDDIPTGPDWTPADPSSLIGYYSEDGFSLNPVPGDSTSFNGHNGDTVLEESAPGHWEMGVSGIEGNETITAAYFDVEVGVDGSVTVTSAANSKRYDVVTVGVDQLERVIVVHYPNVKIGSKEGLTFNRSTLLAYGLTFRTFKGGVDAPYHFKAWGLLADASAKPRVLSVTPSEADTGEQILITGAGLGGITAITVGGVAVAEFTVVSPSQVVAIMPAGEAGEAAVVVTHPDNGASDPFTYTRAGTE